MACQCACRYEYCPYYPRGLVLFTPHTIVSCYQRAGCNDPIILSLAHQQKPERLILGPERRRATQSLPIGGERAHSSVIIFHSSIIAQSARDPLAIAARAGGSRGRLHRSFSNVPLPRVVGVGTLVEQWVRRASIVAGTIRALEVLK